jgi:Bacterial regulatory proteins, luxR family
MALVVCGLLNKQVGGELGINEITVKAHRGRVTRKMAAQISFSGADSVVLAISAEKDRNLRVDLPVVYARIGRCQGRPAWRGYAALL